MMVAAMFTRLSKIYFQPLKCFLNSFVKYGKGYPFKFCCSSTEVYDIFNEAKFECIKLELNQALTSIR